MAWWQWTVWGAVVGAPLVLAMVMWWRSVHWRRRNEPVENHRRSDNGLAPVADPLLPWYKNVLVSPWTWLVVLLFAFGAFALWVQYQWVYSGLVASILQLLEEAEVAPQTLTVGAYNEGLISCLGYAAITLGAYFLLFAIFDRWRPTTPTMKVVALVWGATVATFLSMILNSWVGQLLTESKSGEEIADAATAIFVAPFVEEACKATVLFLLVMAMRRRVVSVLQMIGLAGLSAVGFAFVENIVYYVRLYCTAALVVGPEADAYLRQMFMLRGVYTSFGHPLFTMMTAFGLIAGLKQRSKIARIICPLSGFLVAALLHMCFNGLATVSEDFMPLVIYGLMMILGVTGWLFGQFMLQKRVISWRLDDYVRMGWLRDRDPVVYSAMLSRLKLSVAGWLRGWRIGKATTSLMATVTELAYLRHGEVTGTIDGGSQGRAHELVVAASALRGIALDEPVDLRVVPKCRGPEAWHTFKAWRARRLSRRQAQREAAAALVTPAAWEQPVPRDILLPV